MTKAPEDAPALLFLGDNEEFFWGDNEELF